MEISSDVIKALSVSERACCLQNKLAILYQDDGLIAQLPPEADQPLAGVNSKKCFLYMF